MRVPPCTCPLPSRLCPQEKEKYDETIARAFSSDKLFVGALNSAFEHFLNLNARSPEYISLFMDDKLRKGLKVGGRWWGAGAVLAWRAGRGAQVGGAGAAVHSSRGRDVWRRRCAPVRGLTLAVRVLVLHNCVAPAVDVVVVVGRGDLRSEGAGEGSRGG